MKMTAEHKKQINAAARKALGGAPLHHVEVAWRCCRCPGHPHGRRDEVNLVLLGDCPDHDLADLGRLAEVREIVDGPEGRVRLDLYVYERAYQGRYSEPALYTNLTAVFQDGRLLNVTE